MIRIALVLAAAAAVTSAVPAAEHAAATKLADPATARFRNVAAHGDVVCGEIAKGEGGFTPFYAYKGEGDWEVHASTDGKGRGHGEFCLDREIDTGKKQPACADYDFHFYFAWDHFCR